MFCSSCGAQAAGNFCSACGAALLRAEAPQPEPSVHWLEVLSYEAILQLPFVRERIAQAARRCPKRMTGEELLGIFDAVAPTGVSLQKLTGALLPIFDKWGIHTGKSAEFLAAAPPGAVLLATLCTFAAQGFEMKRAEESSDRCLLTASIPSTVWSNPGELTLMLERVAGGVQVRAVTKISGQLMDFGKSKRLLEELLRGLRADLASQAAAYTAHQPPRRDQVA